MLLVNPIQILITITKMSQKSKYKIPNTVRSLLEPLGKSDCTKVKGPILIYTNFFFIIPFHVTCCLGEGDPHRNIFRYNPKGLERHQKNFVRCNWKEIHALITYPIP